MALAGDLDNLRYH